MRGIGERQEAGDLPVDPHVYDAESVRRKVVGGFCRARHIDAEICEPHGAADRHAMVVAGKSDERRHAAPVL